MRNLRGSYAGAVNFARSLSGGENRENRASQVENNDEVEGAEGEGSEGELVVLVGKSWRQVKAQKSLVEVGVLGAECASVVNRLREKCALRLRKPGFFREGNVVGSVWKL